MTLAFSTGTEDDIPALFHLRRAVAEHLTAQYGQGHWSSFGTEKGIRHAMNTSLYLVARQGSDLVATLRLVSKKPWSIDPSFFTKARRPLYLLDMAVLPGLQRQGVGRQLLAEAIPVARAWPADAIRLDAYDAPAGAGEFYARNGYREVARASYRKTPLIYYERVL